MGTSEVLWWLWGPCCCLLSLESFPKLPEEIPGLGIPILSYPDWGCALRCVPGGDLGSVKGWILLFPVKLGLVAQPVPHGSMVSLGCSQGKTHLGKEPSVSSGCCSRRMHGPGSASSHHKTGARWTPWKRGLLHLPLGQSWFLLPSEASPAAPQMGFAAPGASHPEASALPGVGRAGARAQGVIPSCIPEAPTLQGHPEGRAVGSALLEAPRGFCRPGALSSAHFDSLCRQISAERLIPAQGITKTCSLKKKG